MSGRSRDYVCPECRREQCAPIEGGLCIHCHDAEYRGAVGRDDAVSRSIVQEYRLTARNVLAALADNVAGIRDREEQP